jgi:hypothetical protein
MSTYAGSDASFPATITIVDDGDLVEAATVNAGYQGLADRTAYLRTNLANYKLVSVAAPADDGDSTITQTFTDSFGSGTFAVLLAASNVLVETGDLVFVYLTASVHS